MRPRRLVSIFFLALILCQIGGYYGVLEFLKNRMSDRTAQRIVTEKEPIGGQLILRIPVTSSEARTGEYIIGDTHFSFEGSVYQVIDRHVYEEVLYIVCMRNEQVTDAQETIESFVQSLTGRSADQASGIKFFENLSKYFCSKQYSTDTVAAGWILEQPFGGLESLYHFFQPKPLFHPPAVASL